MKTERLFIAIGVSKATRHNLKTVQAHLRRTDTQVTWVETHNIHVTVKFIGNMGLEKVPRVEEIMREAAAEAAPFVIEMKGISTFPPHKTPRVIFADITRGSKPLERIYRVLNNSLTELGVKREHRDYRPHLTLGRVKSPKNIEAINPVIKRHEDTELGSDAVRELLLIISDLQPSGPEYTVISRIPLTGDFTE